jgi:hypothetical protein
MLKRSVSDYWEAIADEAYSLLSLSTLLSPPSFLIYPLTLVALGLKIFIWGSAFLS